jgi:uncharacterized protein
VGRDVGERQGLTMSNESAPVGSIVETVEELAELYRAPSRVAAAKKTSTLDEATAGFVASAPFALVGTVGADGALDVSPRGGPPGFVRILDERHLVLPDLNGNNLIDSIRAVVATGRVGLLFVVPGQDETVRINGRAWVTTDDATLGLWNDELRRPTTAIVVRTDEVFMHCAKAFRRGRVWDPQSWIGLADAPDGLDVLHAQGLVETNDAETRAHLERSYDSDLAADQPG